MNEKLQLYLGPSNEDLPPEDGGIELLWIYFTFLFHLIHWCSVVWTGPVIQMLLRLFFQVTSQINSLKQPPSDKQHPLDKQPSSCRS